MAIDPKNKQEIDETGQYVQDTLTSVAAKIGENIKSAIESSLDDIDATVLKSIERDLDRTFKGLVRTSSDFSGNVYKVQNGLMGSRDIAQQTHKLELQRIKLAEKLRIASMNKVEVDQEDLNATNLALDSQRKALDASKEQLKTIEKNMGSTGEVFSRLAKNKFFGSILNAEKGLVEMRKEAAKGTKGFSLMGKGIGAAFKGLEKGTVVLFAINQVVKAFRFLIDIMMGANKQAVNLARSFGTSVENAQVLREQFARIRHSTGKTRNNVDALAEASEKINEEFGAVMYASDKILDNQTFLTSRVKLSGEAASKLAIRMATTNESAEGVNKNTVSFMNSFSKATGVGMTFKGVMSSVADAGGQIAASFGFSNEALAKGVLQVRRFGLNLQQASNVASNLLDFEQSIGSELEAELLTGQQFNLERARAKAATGDIAGATADVLSQMQNLTAEQRASPIIMEAIAKATGLSADEIQKAYLIQTNQNAAAKEYERLIRAGMRGEANAFAIRAGIDDKTIKGIEQRKTIEEDFAEAMKDLKSTFTSLVEGGFLRDLTKGAKIFADIVNKMAYMMGIGAEDNLKKIEESNMSQGQKDLAAKLKKRSEGSIMSDLFAGGPGVGGLLNASLGMMKRRQASLALDRMANSVGGEIESGDQLDDFTIRSNPKDTLVMAGGTQFGKETNGLLRQLISAVEGGKVINLDGRRVGETLVMSSYKS